MVSIATGTAGPDFGTQTDAMQVYLAEGERRALALDNRGPIRLNDDGSPDQSILDAYWKYGFYVFRGVISESELADIEADVIEMESRLPVKKGGKLDSQGRPALAVDCEARNLHWVKPLSDPSGGTDHAGGRHPVKMYEPAAPVDAPEHVLQLILGSLQFSDACLRLYAHPKLLAIAEAVNGEDFTPFNEGVWFKYPGLGGSVAWHQDGTTQWDRPDFDRGTHGFNFMAQLHGCTAANGLWIVPGSHVGRADIRTMYEDAGSDRLPDAIPLICDPGDVAICNRQAIHGSFANTSPDLRVTINFGFHRRSSVLGAEGNGIHSPKAVYDEARILERSRLIGYGIDARRRRFPDEVPFSYKPFEGTQEQYQFDQEARLGLKDYNLLDLGI
jgi:ectoine hydroxylase-related dioxygenase (phytanoyl-CoA dioxygenase family)